MALPPNTGAPLFLFDPPFNYGANPGDETWDQPANSNWEAINTFAETVVLYAPLASQTVAQPDGTFFNFNSPIVYGATPALLFGTAANLWDSAITRTAEGSFSFDTNSAGNGQGTGNAKVFNSTEGFQFGGAAPEGHILVGNGTTYVDSATLPEGIVFYQLVQQAGTTISQRNKLNFIAPLTAVDDAGNASTDIGIAPSGIAAGSYTNVNVTVDIYGRITAIASGGALTAVINDVTGERSCNVTYTNTGLNPIQPSGYCPTPGGSSVGNLACVVNGAVIYSTEATATESGGACGFPPFTVPAGATYSVVVTGDVSATPSRWVETIIS